MEVTNGDAIFGLARFLMAVTLELVDQRAINREGLIKALRAFPVHDGESAGVNAATSEWIEVFLEVLERDPKRDPAAPLIPFPKR